MATKRQVYQNEGWTSEGLARKIWARENRRCAQCDEDLPKARRLYCSRKCALRFLDDPRFHGGVLLWSRIGAEILWENKLCQICGAKPSTEVDHKKEIALGGDPFDKANLQALCHGCHMKKTARFLSFGKGWGKVRSKVSRVHSEKVGSSESGIISSGSQASIEEY